MTTQYTEPLDRFTLQMSTDSAAFDGDNAASELAFILRDIADKIEAGADVSMFQTIHDVNGNDVGRYAWKPQSYFRS